MATTLRLERSWAGLGDRKRNWQILLDGKPAGTIALKDTLEVPIAPGRHTLQLTSTGRRRSPERAFQTTDGETADFTCHAPIIWPLYLLALVAPDHWIALKQR